MDLIADGLLFLGALTASLYCLILSRRLRQLNQTEDGLGKVISTLSQQVEDMQAALASAKSVVEAAGGDLAKQTARADRVRHGLEEVVKQAVEQLADVQADIRELGKAREEAKATAKTSAKEGSVSQTSAAQGADRKQKTTPEAKNEANTPGKNTQAEVVTAEAQSPVKVDAAVSEAPEVSASDKAASEMTASDAPVADTAASEPTSVQKAASAGQRSVAATVGNLLAAAETDDDEAFSRRLINALSGIEQPRPEGAG